MSLAIQINNLSKIYPNGHRALYPLSLDIKKGEIFSLLGPNGAGKTTLISILCGIVSKTSGEAYVFNNNVFNEYKEARKLIGLVPQELYTDMFEKVIDTVNFSRGIFGLQRDDVYVKKILTDLSLWDKRFDKIMTLSGGMKRRVLIAKALAHEPKVLFLDEPTSGVDVNLRVEMWDLLKSYKEKGITIILTTHYLNEAEEISDRVGVMSKGKLILVERKEIIISKFGDESIEITLNNPLKKIPEELKKWNLKLGAKGNTLCFNINSKKNKSSLQLLLNEINNLNISYKNLSSSRSSLEEIFVNLIKKN